MKKIILSLLVMFAMIFTAGCSNGNSKLLSEYNGGNWLKSTAEEKKIMAEEFLKQTDPALSEEEVEERVDETIELLRKKLKLDEDATVQDLIDSEKEEKSDSFDYERYLDFGGDEWRCATEAEKINATKAYLQMLDPGFFENQSEEYIQSEIQSKMKMLEGVLTRNDRKIGEFAQEVIGKSAIKS